MERFFQISAVILAGVAAYFLWQGNGDGAFISVVFGAVSFFLSIRFQVKDRLTQRAAEKAEEQRTREAEREEPEVSNSEFQVSGETPLLTADEQIIGGEKQRPTGKEV